MADVFRYFGGMCFLHHQVNHTTLRHIPEVPPPTRETLKSHAIGIHESSVHKRQKCLPNAGRISLCKIVHCRDFYLKTTFRRQPSLRNVLKQTRQSRVMDNAQKLSNYTIIDVYVFNPIIEPSTLQHITALYAKPIILCCPL
jgi:hypothetical protein